MREPNANQLVLRMLYRRHNAYVKTVRRVSELYVLQFVLKYFSLSKIFLLGSTCYSNVSPDILR